MFFSRFQLISSAKRVLEQCSTMLVRWHGNAPGLNLAPPGDHWGRIIFCPDLHEPQIDLFQTRMPAPAGDRRLDRSTNGQTGWSPNQSYESRGSSVKIETMKREY